MDLKAVYALANRLNNGRVLKMVLVTLASAAQTAYSHAKEHESVTFILLSVVSAVSLSLFAYLSTPPSGPPPDAIPAGDAK